MGAMYSVINFTVKQRLILERTSYSLEVTHYAEYSSAESINQETQSVNNMPRFLRHYLFTSITELVLKYLLLLILTFYLEMEAQN
jgi:hypothetical protein